MPHLDAKFNCTQCGSTFTVRLDEQTPFYCETCGEFQAADFPCPLCGAQTRARRRSGLQWVDLEPHNHAEEQP